MTCDGWGHNYDDWRVQIRPCWALFYGLWLFAKRPLHPVIKDYDPCFMAYRLREEWASIQVVWPALPQALSLSLLWVPPCLEQSKAWLASWGNVFRSHLWTTSANIYLFGFLKLFDPCAQVSYTLRNLFKSTWPRNNWIIQLPCFLRSSHVHFTTCPVPFSLGSTRGIQNQHQQGECLFEEELTCECEVASLWLPVLLLYSRLQPMARYLPQQESKSQISCDTSWTV